MLKMVFAAAVAITAVFALRPAQAAEAPWCAVIDIGTGDVYWDCQYYSLEACVPNVLAGNRGFCNENPAYHGPVVRKRPARRHHYRR
jgi:Protein of unknown function (DUF3551)